MTLGQTSNFNGKPLLVFNGNVAHTLLQRWPLMLVGALWLGVISVVVSLLLPAPEYPLMLEHTAISRVTPETTVVAVENLDLAPAQPVQLASTFSPKASRASKTPKIKAPPPIVNINTASVAQLDELPGIGPAFAQRIIDYRTANGPFQSAEQVVEVKGIGPKTYEKMKPYLKL